MLLGGSLISTTKEQFVVDESGNRKAVLLAVERYLELLEAQEELESIRAYDEANSSGDIDDLEINILSKEDLLRRAEKS